MLALVVVATLWQQLKWWWFNTWVNFPVIGRIATLSRDANEDVSYPGWFSGERTLCQEYKNFVHVQDEHDFNEKVTYLTKAGDNGRRNTPGWIWLLTVSMVFVEALGFSYVLAGYTIPGASENLQQTGAYGIAFLISVILVAFTHYTSPAASSMHVANGWKTSAVSSCRPAPFRWPARRIATTTCPLTPSYATAWAPTRPT